MVTNQVEISAGNGNSDFPFISIFRFCFSRIGEFISNFRMATSDSFTKNLLFLKGNFQASFELVCEQLNELVQWFIFTVVHWVWLTSYILLYCCKIEFSQPFFSNVTQKQNAELQKKNAVIAPVHNIRVVSLSYGGEGEGGKPNRMNCTFCTVYMYKTHPGHLCLVKLHSSFPEADSLPLSNSHCTVKFLFMMQENPHPCFLIIMELKLISYHLFSPLVATAGFVEEVLEFTKGAVCILSSRWVCLLERKTFTWVPLDCLH